jgi:ATP-dependent helicase/nuclease subunit A
MAKKEAKLSNMGDVINHTFENDFDDNNLYEIVEHYEKSSSHEELSLIHLNQYPTTSRLAELYVPSEEKHLKHVLNIEKSGRKGSLLHDILANASTETEVNKFIEELVLYGTIQEDEVSTLNTAALEVLNNKDLQSILSKATESITEKNIVDADGKMHRPDRVLITDDGVIILDYKFTLEESESHVRQVDRYKELLVAMEYENVQTYLFYAISGKLKLV